MSNERRERHESVVRVLNNIAALTLVFGVIGAAVPVLVALADSSTDNTQPGTLLLLGAAVFGAALLNWALLRAVALAVEYLGQIAEATEESRSLLRYVADATGRSAQVFDALRARSGQ